MANDQLGIASSQNRSFKRRIRINGPQKRARGSKSELRSCIMRFRYTVLPLPTYTYTRELLLPRLSAGRIAKPQDENLVPCIGRHYSQFIQFSVMLPMHVNFRHKNSVGRFDFPDLLIKLPFSIFITSPRPRLWVCLHAIYEHIDRHIIHGRPIATCEI